MFRNRATPLFAAVLITWACMMEPVEGDAANESDASSWDISSAPGYGIGHDDAAPECNLSEDGVVRSWPVKERNAGDSRYDKPFVVPVGDTHNSLTGHQATSQVLGQDTASTHTIDCPPGKVMAGIDVFENAVAGGTDQPEIRGIQIRCDEPARAPRVNSPS